MTEADENFKKQQKNPLKGADNLIEVLFDENEKIYSVKFPYNLSLVREMQTIRSAQFDRSAREWKVNLEDYDALFVALRNMNNEIQFVESQSVDLEQRARRSAQLLMHANGTDVSIEPMISYYRDPETPTAGKIINVNVRFAAQLLGFGREDGAAFIRMHDMMDLDQPLFKGDNVVIQYDEKGRGKVSERGKTLTEKLDESLGKYVDGIKVVEHDGKYKVSFDYNPVLQERVQRIIGCEFNKEERVWEIEAGLQPFVARAVNEMRKEFVADRADREQIEQVAQSKIDEAKVKDAFIKDDQSYSGKVLAKNDRYVLQHTGKEYMTVHRTTSLNSEIDVGSSMRVTYQKGRGQVTNKSLQKEQGVER